LGLLGIVAHRAKIPNASLSVLEKRRRKRYQKSVLLI
jgi:hypothetical protein